MRWSTVAARAGTLPELLVNPSRARKPALVPAPGFIQALDDSKKNAVQAAMGSADVLLVRGPPGTGKTTFITELVLQELRRQPGARVLVASQSNAALDHALAGIHELQPDVVLLRVARADGEKVAVSSEPLLLAAHLDRWKREAVATGTDALRRWAVSEDLDVEAIDAASWLSVLASGLRELADLDATRAEADARLQELRGSRGRASQSATTSQLVRERQEEINELREAHAVCVDRNREAATRLIALGQLSRQARLSSLAPEELEAQADTLLPANAAGAEACRRRLALLSEWHARFGLGPAFKAAALARANVVAATCVGLGGLRGAESVEFDLVIVDEASKATAPEMLIPLSRARRIVLVGDDRQLPPYIEEGALDEEQLAERGLTAEELKTPLFKQLADALPDENVVALTHQHRMNPSIGALVSACFYEGQLTSEPRERLGWLDQLVPRPVTWLSTSAIPGCAERRAGPSSSVINELEVRVAAALLVACDDLASAAGTHPFVAALTGYAAQRDALEQRIARDRPRFKAITVECQTVDAFQGRQADVVLFSLTRSNESRKLGFVRERPRLNVALSRARDTLILIGDSVFARNAQGGGELRRVLEHIEACPDDCTVMKATAP